MLAEKLISNYIKLALSINALFTFFLILYFCVLPMTTAWNDPSHNKRLSTLQYFPCHKKVRSKFRCILTVVMVIFFLALLRFNSFYQILKLGTTKLNAIVDDKSNVTKMIQFVFDMVEIEKIASNLHFHLSFQVFKCPSSSESLKMGTLSKTINLISQNL